MEKPVGDYTARSMGPSTRSTSEKETKGDAKGTFGESIGAFYVLLFGCDECEKAKNTECGNPKVVYANLQDLLSDRKDGYPQSCTKKEVSP